MAVLGPAFYAHFFSITPHFDCFINSIVELPPYAFAKTAFNRLGRRLSLFLGLSIGGLACLATYAVPGNFSGPVNLVLLLSLIAKFCITFTYLGKEIPPVWSEARNLSLCSFISSSDWWSVFVLFVLFRWKTVWGWNVSHRGSRYAFHRGAEIFLSIFQPNKMVSNWFDRWFPIGSINGFHLVQSMVSHWVDQWSPIGSINGFHLVQSMVSHWVDLWFPVGLINGFQLVWSMVSNWFDQWFLIGLILGEGHSVVSVLSSSISCGEEPFILVVRRI